MLYHVPSTVNMKKGTRAVMSKSLTPFTAALAIPRQSIILAIVHISVESTDARTLVRPDIGSAPLRLHPTANPKSPSRSATPSIFTSIPPYSIPAPSQYQLKMGIFRKTLKLTTIGATATLGSFFYATRNCSFVPVDPATDPIFSWKPFRKLNPSRNPTVHDLCVRRVPLSEINPALLEKKGRLVEAFCAGVWSGWGMCRYNIYIYIYIHTESYSGVH